ncbi:hypothetical protein KM043_005496 [Ampulex compressa]|nr:hypothetical protein KM043_005496 [Ampulex compressa]
MCFNYFAAIDPIYGPVDRNTSGARGSGPEFHFALIERRVVFRREATVTIDDGLKTTGITRCANGTFGSSSNIEFEPAGFFAQDFSSFERIEGWAKIQEGVEIRVL